MARAAREPRPPATDSRRTRGRPRDPQTAAAIVAAARRLLVERGYARFSLDAVAAEAGVGKPTIYRRWASKEALATAALATAIDVEPAPPAGASLAEEILFLAERLRRRLEEGNGMVLVGTILAEEREAPELAAVFRREIWERRRRRLEDAFLRGRQRGEIRTDADLDAAIHMLIGSMYARHLSGGPLTRPWLARVVETLLRGLG